MAQEQEPTNSKPLDKWDARYRPSGLPKPVVEGALPPWSAYYDSTGLRTDIRTLYEQAEAKRIQNERSALLTDLGQALIKHRDQRFPQEDSDQGREIAELQGLRPTIIDRTS